MSMDKPKQRFKKKAAAKPSSIDTAREASQVRVKWVIVIFATALSLRVLYLIQIQSIPLFYNLPGDGRTYDEWAQRIAAGDWLGSGVFYQAPLYPYFLGIWQAILGHNLWAIRMIQAALGALSCALIFLVGERLFSRSAGVASGLVLAFYAPAIFFDVLIEKSVLDVFLLSLLLWVLVCAWSRRDWRRWLSAGAILGLLGLSRENALILAVVVPVWIAIYFSEQALKYRVAWTGWFLAGLILVLIPVGLRNLAVGGEFKLTTSQLGANFFIGNNPAADGTYGSVHKIIGEPNLEGSDARRLAERATGRKMAPGEVSDFWLQKASAYIRSEPLSWVWLLGKKWLMVWNAREVEDSDDFYIYSQWSWLLQALGWLTHFGVLAPLAAVGVWMSRRQWRDLWLLYTMILSLALSVAIFYVFGRYRFPLIPLLTLFTGAALVGLVNLFRSRGVESLAVSVVVLLASALIVNWPLYGIHGPGPVGYNNLSNAYYKQGKIAEAISAARQALEADPDLGVAYYNLGNMYAAQGKFDIAKEYFERAIAIYPNYAEVRSNYGQLIAERGDLETGIRYFREAIALNPSISRAHLNLGVALAKEDRLEEAIQPLQRAVDLTPNLPEASYYLGSVYAAQNRYADAAAAFNHALQIRADFVPAHESLAQLLLLQGNKEKAMEHYQEARRLMQQARSNTAAGRR
jgi:Tfp pilus assembly protein PilF/4-amino-4-deoxy-L-arabinose transferase-like glycosyltransferase